MKLAMEEQREIQTKEGWPSGQVRWGQDHMIATISGLRESSDERGRVVMSKGLRLVASNPYAFAMCGEYSISHCLSASKNGSGSTGCRRCLGRCKQAAYTGLCAL